MNRNGTSYYLLADYSQIPSIINGQTDCTWEAGSVIMDNSRSVNLSYVTCDAVWVERQDIKAAHDLALSGWNCPVHDGFHVSESWLMPHFD